MKNLILNDIRLNDAELKSRLLGDSTTETLQKCGSALKDILRVAEFSYCFRATVITYGNNTVDLGFGKIESSALIKNLQSAKNAYVVAVTLGIAVERLLQKKAATSTAEHFIFDAVASTLTETVCDEVQNLLPNKSGVRFSPGYGDLDLKIQKPLLKFLKADGITLTDSGLMVPSKSVTFIAREL